MSAKATLSITGEIMESIDLDEVKTCPGCIEIKTLRDYYFDKRYGSFTKICKECVKRAATARFHNNREAVYEQRKPRRREYLKVVRRTNEEARLKDSARKAAKRYFGTATMKRCANCGKQAEQWHHHNGYEKDHWLDVTPLCIPCHQAADRLQGVIRGRGRRA